MQFNLYNKIYFLENNKRKSVTYTSIIILSLIYLLPYFVIGSESATLVGNQIKILFTFLGAIVILILQRKKASFYFITFFLFLYFITSSFLFFSGFGIYFFRALSLTYIVVSYMTLVIFENKVNVEINKIKSLFFYIQIMSFLLIFYVFYVLKNPSLILRPHGLIIFYIILEVSGCKLGRLNAFVLLLGTLLMSYISYNSRIAQIVVFLIFINEYGFKNVLLYSTPFFLLAYFNSDLFIRFSDSGLEDFGRAYIYDCFFNNFNKLNYFLPTYTGLENCYDFEYLHSSYLILFVEYGSISGGILVLTSLFLFIKILFKKNDDYPTLLIFLAVFLFSSVEGGMEWFYLFILGLSFSKIRSRYFLTH